MPSYSSGLIEVATTLYEAAFQTAYQQKARKFAGATTVIAGVVGEAYVMKESDEWMLHDRDAYHSEIDQTIPTYRNITVTPNDKIALIPSDIFEQAMVNASERMVQAKNAVYALSRAQDQIDIDAMDAAQGSMSDHAATSNLDIEALTAAQRALDLKNVPSEDRFFVANYEQKASLLAEQKVTSSDYASIKALVNGQIDTFMGFKFIWIGTMPEGGLSYNNVPTNTIRNCYAFHKDAIRSVYWLNPGVTVDWLPTKQSYAIIPKLKMGSVVRNTDGFVWVKCTQS